MCAYEVTDRTVVCALLFFGEKTGRQFPVLPVIMKTFTAFIFPAARTIRAVAILLVKFDLAFHRSFLFSV